MMHTIRTNATVAFNTLTITGDIEYNVERRLLVIVDDETGMPEPIGSAMEGLGITAEEGQTIIKDYSENAGVTDSLVAAGVVAKRASCQINQFGSMVHLVDVLVLTDGDE